MRKTVVHLITVAGTLVFLYVGSRVEHALQFVRSRTFREDWGLFLLSVLALIVLGAVLALPHLWAVSRSRQRLMVNPVILAVYAIPGAYLVMIFSMSRLAGMLYMLINAASPAGSGVEVVGGMLIGYGIIQSITPRDPEVEVRRSA